MTERIVLRGGTVVDGTGAPAFRGDVAVADGRITAIGPGARSPGGREVDAAGLVVSPGFVDLHTHCDYTLPRHPRARSYVRQGVTTMVVGNCGFSPFPFTGEPYGSFLAEGLDFRWRTAAEYRDHLASLPLPVNVALLVGHGSVRHAVLGSQDRPPTPGELDQMRSWVAEAFDAGAFGLSSGLVYAPGCFAHKSELVELARVARMHGGFYATHMRDEGSRLLASVEEAVQVARRAGIQLQLSHHKAIGRPNWGSVRTSLALVDDVRRGGLDVLCDQYPYAATSTSLEVCLPQWVLAVDAAERTRLLSDDGTRERIAAEIRQHASSPEPAGRPVDPTAIMIAGVAGETTPMSGKRLTELAGDGDAVDVMLDLLREHGGRVEIVDFNLAEDDVREVMRHDTVCVASDGWVLEPAAGGNPHPRSYGTFARVLGHYVREQGVLTLETAVHKMTGLPARRLGRTDIGTLRPGAAADVTVFDAARVSDLSTYLKPHRYAVGVEHVLVGGEFVLRDGAETDASPGQVLDREDDR